MGGGATKVNPESGPFKAERGTDTKHEIVKISLRFQYFTRILAKFFRTFVEFRVVV